MTPAGAAGLEQILARLTQLEAHLDGQDEHLAELALAVSDLHFDLRVLRRDIRRGWPPDDAA